jgi:hypothetical protein
MSLRLRALELHIPAWVTRSAVRRLFEVTASAFGRDPPRVDGSDHRALLERYASFTARSVEMALAGRTDLDELSRRMWNGAHGLGTTLRRRLGVRTRGDALRAARLAYRMIGIDVRADPDGRLVVDRCFFADGYSPQVCRVMSSLVAGMIAGLTEGGRLTFSERITEGRPRCLARIAWEGASTP